MMLVTIRGIAEAHIPIIACLLPLKAGRFVLIFTNATTPNTKDTIQHRKAQQNAKPRYKRNDKNTSMKPNRADIREEVAQPVSFCVLIGAFSVFTAIISESEVKFHEIRVL
jgi:hypothetical protein